MKRLRNHPSIALWCGNNEGQIINELLCHKLKVSEPYEGEKLFDTVIANLAATLVPLPPYGPGPPFGGPMPNSMKPGDVHDGTVWPGTPPIPDDRLIGEVDR